MLPIFVGLLAFGLIVALALTFGRRGQGQLPIATRSGVDGFWISTRGLRAGTRLRYDCMVRSSRHYGEVIVEPGPDELFVYTGNTPSDIALSVLGYGSTQIDDDDNDDGAISLAAGGSFLSDDSYSTGSDGGSSGSTGDYGSSGAAVESSAADAGGGFPPAY